MVVEERALVAIGLDELLVEVGAAFAESLGFFDEADKDGGNASINDFHGEKADGESKEETNDSDEPATNRTVDSVGDQTTNKTSEKTTDDAASGQDHSSDIVVDDGFESVLHKHVPSRFSRLAESLSVNGDLGEGITVEVLHEAVEDAQDARQNSTQDTSLSNASSQGLDDGNEERSQANRTERSAVWLFNH